MKRLNRKAKINHIERAIEAGLEKIPEEEKKRLIDEEKLNEKRKLQEVKQSLWRLRKKEKKLENSETEKIRNMVKKLETIKEILDKEKEKKTRQEKVRT